MGSRLDITRIMKKKISGGGPGSSSRQSQCSCSSTSHFDYEGVIEYIIRYSISILSLVNQFVFDRIYYQNMK